MLSSILAYGQSAVVSGTMLDTETGEPLMFASILVQELGTGTDTDIDGKYQLKLAPGTYTFVASYVGYTSKTITDVVAKEGEVVYLDFSLSEETEVLQEVTISAKVIERSENAVMVLQRKSDKIQDGISAQEMSRFAVGNAAGAMQKVTGATISGDKYIYIRGLGDRYSLTQLNGLIMPSSDPYRNGAQLDLIPSNLIENIITAKTFTPDQPGTFTGGNVNIKTKSFPEQFTLTISASGTFNAQNNFIDDFRSYDGGENDYWGFDDGGRDVPGILEQERYANLPNFVSDNNFRRNVALTTRLPGAYSDDIYSSKQDLANAADELARAFDNNFETSNVTTPMDHGLSLSFGNQYQVANRPLGIILSTSFNKNYSHRPAFDRKRWLLENAADGELISAGDYAVTQSDESADLTGLAGISYKLAEGHTIGVQGLYSHNGTKTGRYIFGTRPENIIGNDRYIGRSLVWSERELINLQASGEHVIQGLNNLKIEWIYGNTNSNLKEPDTKYFDEFFEGASGNSFISESDGIPRPFHFYRNLDDVQNDYKIDVTIPLNEKKSNKLKVGSLISRKSRDFTEQRFQYAENRLQIFDRTSNEFVVYGAEPYNGKPNEYLSDSNIGITDIIQYQEGADQGYVLGNYIVDSSDPNNAYSGEENVDAFYGMLTLGLTDKLRFVGGARYELTDISVMGGDTTGTINEGDLLPSGNLIYGLNENSNLRASFSQTLARPNLREIAPFAAFDPQIPIIFKGNTELTYTNITNYDLRYEYFMRPGELFAISAYFKTFENPIVLYQVNNTNNEFQYLNVPTAEVAGLELEFRKSLDFISPRLSNFKLNTNLSYIYSRADAFISPRVVDTSDRPFEGQSPFIINTTLIYDLQEEKGFEALISLNILGDRLNSVGDESAFDIYDQGRAQLDFSVSKRWDRFNARLSVRNILDSPFVNYANYIGTEYTREDFRTGIDFRLGVSYTIK
ncbi:MAG: TonB-dependent receptor [Saprospiraceae bacterium]